MLDADNSSSNTRNFVHKLKIVLWKCITMRKHGLIMTIIESFLPVIMYTLLFLLIFVIPDLKSKYNKKTKTYPKVSLEMVIENLHLFYAPNNPDVNNIMNSVTGSMSNYHLGDFPNEPKMLNHIRSLLSNKTFVPILAVVFNNYHKDSHKLSYRILANFKNVDTTSAFQREAPYAAVAAEEYIDNGFVELQKNIDFAFINLKSNDKLSQQNVKIELQMMPTPPHDVESEIINFIKPYFFVLSFLPLYIKTLLPSMIVEKLLGVRQITYVMGLEPWQHWFGWFLYTFFAYIINISLLTVLLTINILENLPTFFENSNGFIIWLFLFFFYLSTVTTIFLFASIFKKYQYAEVAASIWIVAPLFLQKAPFDSCPVSLIILLMMLIPITTFSIGLQCLVDLERIGGIHFSNLYKKPSKFSNVPSIGLVLFMFIFDTVLYFLLAWYIDKLFPGDFGVPQRWNFVFKKSFWKPKVESAEITETSAIEIKPGIEPVKGLDAGIKIRNLTKIYKNKYAVDGLTMDIYSKQITVLLGHNGAGKTTTIGMITGMIPITSGTVVINGYNLERNVSVVQKFIGLCLQNNTEIPYLTVLDHLTYFAMLRGSTPSEAKSEALYYLEISNLKSKANTQPDKLSGGMRRKLAIGMAMVGNSKVVLLDEPTSGLDPQARRDLWDFLLATRGEKTILITTHYMEEADVLGDRIAIMHSGHLICHGTSLFLKNYYGTGYKLNVLAKSADSSAVLAFIRTFVPSAFVKSSKMGSIEYSLPTNNTNTLSNLIQSLEKQKSQLGINHFGLCITSLEDVFIKAGEIADASKGATNINQTLIQSDDDLTVEFSRNYLLIFKALCYKRLYYYKHNILKLLFIIIFPIIIFQILMSLLTAIRSTALIGEQADLTLNMYDEPVSYFEASDSSLADDYANVVRAQGGIAVETEDVPKSILSVVKRDPSKYHRNLITAAEFNSGMQIVAMYGHYAAHGPAISINLITNTLLHWCTSTNDYSIKTAVSPIPKSFKTESIAISISVPLAFNYCFFLFFSKCILIMHEENIIGFKHLQQMAGVPKLLYWLAAFIFDFISYLFINFICVFSLFFYDYNGVIGSINTLKHVAYVIFIFGFSCLPFIYTIVLYSFLTLFAKSTTGDVIQTLVLMYFLLYGIILPLVVFFVTQVYALKFSRKVFDVFINLFHLRPPFAITLILIKIFWKATQIDMQLHNSSFLTSLKERCDAEESPFCKAYFSFYTGKDGIQENLTFLYWDILLYWGLLLIYDFGVLSYCRQVLFGAISCKTCESFKEPDANIDIDVLNERDRVKTQLKDYHRFRNDVERDQRMDIFLVKNIHKWFCDVYAVRGLHFGVKKGECFGLLGVNGAGKTTTFKILTGEIFHNTGNAYFQSYNLNFNRCFFFNKMGYAPQFDGFINDLTVYEMLYIYGCIRGIPSKKIKTHIDKWLAIFDIHMYKNTQCAKLSGGTKRKVSSALSLIGNPKLVLLDEPTSGIDPVARRNLWDVLAVLQKSGRSVVLTSQSMDECEALCDRLAIMVEGQFHCIGNIQYLKSKFGYGCTLKIKVFSDTTDEALKNLKENISSQVACILQDEHVGMLEYKITNKDVALSQVFILMESLKSKYPIIEDYSISSANLEEIFLSFAKKK